MCDDSDGSVPSLWGFQLRPKTLGSKNRLSPLCLNCVSHPKKLRDKKEDYSCRPLRFGTIYYATIYNQYSSWWLLPPWSQKLAFPDSLAARHRHVIWSQPIQCTRVKLYITNGGPMSVGLVSGPGDPTFGGSSHSSCGFGVQSGWSNLHARALDGIVGSPLRWFSSIILLLFRLCSLQIKFLHPGDSSNDIYLVLLVDECYCL